MISTYVKKHDNYNIELKLNYNFKDIKKTKKYDLDMFLFIPESLNINKNTYNKEEFYNTKQSYIRFMTPRFEIMQIVAKPFDNLEKCIDHLLKETTKKNKKAFIFQIKIFGSIFKSSLRDNVVYIKKQVKNDKEMFNSSIISKLIDEISIILSKYRKLMKKIQGFVLDDEIFKVYRFGDEYLSFIIEKYFIEIYKLMKNENIKKTVLSFLNEEKKYREKSGYANPNQDEKNNQKYLYKAGELKKFINSALFLNITWKKEGYILEQAVLSLTAGLAMLVATGLSTYYQSKYSNLSYLVVLFLALTYVLKDRLKDLSRMFFSSKLRKRLYDHIISIKPKNGRNLGFLKEGFVIRKYKSINNEIKNLREQEHLTDVEYFRKAENILVYKKYVKLFPKRINKYLGNYMTFGINDITRINFQKFLKSMDNPEKLIGITDENGISYVKGKRTYNVNMIVRMRYKSRIVGYRRYRVVLNRKGIIKLEEVKLGLKNI